MTDTPEPLAAEEPASTTDGGAADKTAAATRQPVWSRLNRISRVAALILGAVGAVLASALIFAAGVWVGVENADHEGHHDQTETSEYNIDEHETSDESDGGTRNEGDRQSDDRSHDEGEHNQDQPRHEQHEAPSAPPGAPQAPSPTPRQ
ncbi:hypothetical protein [Mycobacterium sp. 155]|uniref:hypothetical protein n=1 Tax=Mycobacterium sp. 155 TaxID=1157943 RepID=UPI0012FB9090|nr:hypothetical protein [Mycobacterium sp. 155]